LSPAASTLLLGELFPHIPEFATHEYGKFVVMKMMQYMPHCPGMAEALYECIR
jgi:hypothetical protein